MTCQSRMRPTKGEMRVHPNSAAAMACAIENMSVRLQDMPSFCSTCDVRRVTGGRRRLNAHARVATGR